MSAAALFDEISSKWPIIEPSHREKNEAPSFMVSVEFVAHEPRGRVGMITQEFDHDPPANAV